MKHIGCRPTREMYLYGGEVDVQCARCGSSAESHRCDRCHDGLDGHECGEDCCCCAYPEPNVLCQHCNGEAVWHECVSSPEWCEANPLPGREGVRRGVLEWYTAEGAR